MRIGVDLGGTKIESVLLGDDGQVHRRRRTPTPASEGYEAVLAEIVAHVRELDDLAGAPCPVGVGTPGVVVEETGRLRNSNSACLRGRTIRDDLDRLLGRSVVVRNDANCFAEAEATLGAARGHRVVFGIILGTGVGGGLVIDGRARVGLHGIAGEWGHSPIGEGGPLCYCGQHGCVETRLSGPALERDYLERAGLPGGDSPRVPEIAARAEAGDPHAIAALDAYLGHFGEGIARLIHVLDPDAIVLGGGVSLLDRLYDEGRERVAQVLFHDELRTPILPAELGDSAGVFGAALATR